MIFVYAVILVLVMIYPFVLIQEVIGDFKTAIITLREKIKENKLK